MREATRRARHGTAVAAILLVPVFAVAAPPAGPARSAAPSPRPSSLNAAALSAREAHRDTTGLARVLLRGSSPSLRASAARALGRIQNRG